VHHFAIDLDQGPPGCCRSRRELTRVARVPSRLDSDRHVRQPAMKIILHALGQSEQNTMIQRVVDENDPVEELR
jgi:hypothetical protein